MNKRAEHQWKTHVQKNGDLLESKKVFESLILFWQMTDSEKRALINMATKYFEGPGKFEELFELYKK